jgi:ATP-binding cassette, subfamily B, bacterial
MSFSFFKRFDTTSPVERTKVKLSSFAFLKAYLKPYPYLTLFGLLSILIISLTTLIMGVGIRSIVNDGFKDNYTKILVFLSIVVFFLGGATYVRYLAMSYLGEKMVADIRRKMYQHVLTLDPAFFERVSVGEVLSRITVDTTFIQHLISTTFPIALRNMMMAIGGCVMLYLTSPDLTYLMVILVPLILTALHTFGQRIRKFSTNTQALVGQVNEYLEETLNAVRTIQAFCHEEFDRRTFNNRMDASIQGAFERIKARAVLSTMVIFFVFGGLTAIIWVGGYKVEHDLLSLGELTSFLFFGLTVAGSINNFIEVISDFQKAVGACDRVQELFQMQSAVTITAAPLPLPKPGRGEIKFEKVQFAYSNMTDSQALIDFNLHVHPGEKVAVVGPSGSGKTTVFHLLLRFYDPSRGHITLDGIDLRDLDLRELRDQIGFVAQDPIVFSGTVYDNIRYGRPDATFEQIQEAAEAAMVTEFMERLPKGFYTHIGKKGVSLSTGQKQRIAIARAILKNPRILLLDEATSALDAQNEQYVQQALNRLMVDRTTIMIAHRLSTILQADQIVVINNGRVEAMGKHKELLAQKGLYNRLATLQFIHKDT